AGGDDVMPLFQRAEQGRQVVGVRVVVVVQVGDVGGLHVPQADVARTTRVPVRLRPDQTDSGVGVGEHHVLGVVGGTVGDDDQTPIAHALVQGALDRAADLLGAVVGRADDVDSGGGRTRFRPAHHEIGRASCRERVE